MSYLLKSLKLVDKFYRENFLEKRKFYTHRNLLHVALCTKDLRRNAIANSCVKYIERPKSMAKNHEFFECLWFTMHSVGIYEQLLS